MSSPEHDGQAEQRSSVKIAMTAKGEPTVEVKVYDGATQDDLDALRAIAVNTYKKASEEVGR